jgi:hypothetical protein
VKGICKNSANSSKDQPENHGHKERGVVQATGMQNLFNNIITENFPNLKKVLRIQV